ncbi:MAG TPA: hypothetical protein DCQ04_14460 [Actinobacteria bacterium]|jgi:hypothetical protein|nr:hypothetical protein [Actinomycetota bacterium]
MPRTPDPRQILALIGACISVFVAMTLGLGSTSTASAAVAKANPETSASTSLLTAEPAPIVAADNVKVEKCEDFYGDEPVIATLQVKVTVGVPGSTKIRWVHNAPGEVASGVEDGQSVDIQNKYGDAWFRGDRSAKAYDWNTLTRAKGVFQPDVIINLTALFDGDFTPGSWITDSLESTMSPNLKSLTKKLEEAHIVLSPSDPAKTKAALDELLKDIRTGISAPNWTSIFTWLKMFATGDKDDPVGVGVSAFIPVLPNVINSLKTFKITPSSLGLNEAWMMATTKQYSALGNYVNIEARAGFLTSSWNEWHTTYESHMPLLGNSTIKYVVRYTAHANYAEGSS